jgi:hypothetical protein
MSKSKEHKILVGQSRPTENRAMRVITSESTKVWIDKIDAANRTETSIGVRGAIDATTVVVMELIKEIQAGRVAREVISELVKQRPIGVSLARAQALLRK